MDRVNTFVISIGTAGDEKRYPHTPAAQLGSMYPVRVLAGDAARLQRWRRGIDVPA